MDNHAGVVTNYQSRFVSKLTKDTLALVLAGGRGSRLKDLTTWRVKPAVPFGGKYRIIDFPLSNCVNSDIRQIGVISQYKAHSLIRHIQKGWQFFRGEFGEFIELLPAQQRLENSWYLGTANAVYQNLDIIRSHNPGLVLVLAGDHVYKMDYGPMLAFHVENSAALTVGCIEVPIADAGSFGVMSINSDKRILAFTEKPEQPIPMPDKDNAALVSMGIYVFNTEFLIEQLILDADNPNSIHDFGFNIIPSVIDQYRVFAYPFYDGARGRQAYWRDVGTVDSYWQANMELIGVSPELNLYDKEWPIWTYQEQAPPGKFVFNDNERRGSALDSLVADGCIIAGGEVVHSMLFNNVRLDAYSMITDSVVLPDVHIGEYCRISKAVIDKGAVLPAGTVIGQDLAQDSERYYVTEQGVVLVTPDMLGQSLHFAR
ncbi:MAG: glucose-1-phosphate adenylyltransferase [Oceanicoccus sp.]|uniref:glucose-1-phosphate adenylyltransferase n=1 Tax=Oceanicoccus sp. TaxID=2691044 RepID=UPI002639FCFC|nr:glucose-1-phosphate adenylyltransferase [Oceanicoccus sp.]MCP3908701.1 glucose-1-phosphate adenylyltransferase [Oceanicoccus sp.]MDG1772473.1 glucose-1-phosphate adenylyltransferase [Oceanicoccus sp.]